MVIRSGDADYVIMGAKAIPHLMARLDENEPVPPELIMVPMDGLPDSGVISPDPMLECGPAPRESQGPARLLSPDQLDNLLGWYV